MEPKSLLGYASGCPISRYTFLSMATLGARLEFHPKLPKAMGLIYVGLKASMMLREHHLEIIRGFDFSVIPHLTVPMLYGRSEALHMHYNGLC
jgi:hypothetical protein